MKNLNFNQANALASQSVCVWLKPFLLILVLTFLFILTVNTGKAQITRADAKLAMQCYNNAFYNQYGTYGASYKAMYYRNTDRNIRSWFWWEVESIETLIDAYVINNDPDFKNKIQYLYHGIRDAHGLTWANNKYNDDLIWGALMCIRAFYIFNDGGMKDMAINNFNIVWNRGWDNAVGGGLWWTTDKKSKNACVNAPAAICAMMLYYATGDVNFRNKAKQIMDWMRVRLYDANTGEVKGAINAAGSITEGARTYTQGTFIGAAGELHSHYPGDNWRAMGQKAMDYTRSRMCNSAGLLPDEYCGVDDCPGFKGIFARWACKFVKDFGLTSTYGPWLTYNAKQAWSYRNLRGLIWAQWWRRTPDGYLTSWETTSGIAMMNNVFLFTSGATAGKETTDGVENVNVASTQENDEALSIYPTPAERTIILPIEEGVTGFVSIINSNGNTVRTAKINSKEIDVADLPNGMYTVVVEKNGEKIQKRFVKN